MLARTVTFAAAMAGSSLPIYAMAAFATRIPSFRAINYNALRSKPNLRSFSSSNAPLDYIPHAFSLEEATKRINEADSQRLFAPMTSFKKSTALAISNGQPIKKVLIPTYGVNAAVAKTHFSGEWGEDYTVTSTDDKGNTTSTTYTDWYPVSGSLGSCNYDQEAAKMLIYAGFSWKSVLIEQALNGYRFTRALQKFDETKVEADVVIDPFLKRLAIGKEIANQRVKSEEEGRIEKAIKDRAGWRCDHVRIHSYTINYDYFNLTANLLPAYILQYSHTPPRILPALCESDKNVFGAAPLSIGKTMAASALTTTAASIFFPQIAIPLRIAGIATSSFLTGLWARYHLSARYAFQERKLNSEKSYNETVAETFADKLRFEATSRHFSAPDVKQVLDVDPDFYQVMGLDPSKEITERDVQQAFHNKILEAHPDKGGSAEQTRKIIAARNGFITAINHNPQTKSTPGKRYFSTLTKERPVTKPLRSVFDPNAKALQQLVLVKKDYPAALKMIKNGEVHPDGHDNNENTLLTEAVKREDLDAVKFAVEKAGANLDTSCDCPLHDNPLIYAARYNKSPVITEYLLSRKANPNLINVKGQTPRDIAHQRGHKQIEQALINHGGQLHHCLEGSSGTWARFRGRFFAYSPDDRTLLLDKQNIQYLPPSAKR